MKVNIHRLLTEAKDAIPQAEWIGLRRVTNYLTGFSAIDGKFDEAAGGSDEGVMLEVLYKGTFSYAATADLSSGGIKCAAKQAFAAALAAQPYGIHRFDQTMRPAAQVRYATKREKLSGIPAAETVELLCSICDAAKVSSKIIQTAASCEMGICETEMVSTNGADIRQTVRFGGITMNAVAREGDIIQQRSAHGRSALTYQGGRELFNPAALLEKARKAGTEAVELLTAEPCPNGKRTLVLMPDQMMLQIHESVGHALEIDRILGDERNYAGGSFITPEDIGSFRYGSPLMNVAFDPTIAQELASYGADDIGNAAVKEYLIKDGILIRALGSLESHIEALAYFRILPEELIIAGLNDWAQRPKKDNDKIIFKAYAHGDFARIPALLQKDTEFNPESSLSPAQQQQFADWFVQQMIVARNRNWLPKIQAEAAKQPTLFAVGTAHLVGNQGLIMLLRHNGYQVEPMPKLAVWQ